LSGTNANTFGHATAPLARTAVGHRGDDDVIALLDPRDAGADGLDDAGAFVTHQRWRGPGDGAVHDAHIAVAHTSRDDAHPHFTVAWRAHLDVVADLGLLAHPHNAPHIPSLL
jgi:hypothetical protein